ncbi:solute carrier family 26 member 6, like [Boleophthalmus pectinirostris]|uniref:solute carrier family 26 member 6, like n=1 Tax=Boleophthalmus pectinirostris TaxID=150288 RepID=UPI0024313FAA|nr:solute carrier family 26 member 6, like [Boleophthalmus pectinirostris]
MGFHIMDSHKFGKYRVERQVLNEERLEEVAYRKSYYETHPPFSNKLKDSLRCSLPRLKRWALSKFPVLYWLPKYSLWDYGMPDLISGISVGIMHLPQGMAYALLASLPPVFGLYSSLYPPLIYLFFGTSRHISIGTFTVLSIMVGSVTETLAPDTAFLINNGTNITTEVNITARDLYRVQVAAATTVLGGLIQMMLGMVKFGFVGTYLAEPLVRAYTTAAAVHAVIGQIKYIFGISPTRFSGPLSLVYTFGHICALLPETHLPTLVVSAVSIVCLVVAKELNAFLRPKLPVPIPVELIMIVSATVISSYSHLSSNYTISVVGEIPSGLSPPCVPDVNLFRQVIGDAFALAIVGYAISISLGKTFALKHGYKVDSNQELLALGLCNMVGGFFECFAVCPSMSRSLIQESTGGKTQIASLASAVIVLVTIMKLGPLFQELPKAVLASIVLVNLKSMFKQLFDIVILWKRSKIDLLIWLVTLISTLLLNLDMGLAASIAFALLSIIVRTQMPTYSVLGNIRGTDVYVDIETHKQAREIPGITIFHSSATVYFANADLYLEALKDKSGLDISKMIIYKRRQEAKQRRRERRAERRAKRQAKKEKRQAQRASEQLAGAPVFSVEEEAGQWMDMGLENISVGDNEEQKITKRENGTVFVMPTTPRTPDGQCRWEYLKGEADPENISLSWLSELPDGDTTTLGSSSEDTLSQDLERVSLGSLGKWTWDIHSIILDLSTANFIDTVAMKTIQNIFQDFSEIDVDIYLAGCQTSVVEQLERGCFFSESITKKHLFATVHDAVLFCLNHRGARTFTRYEPSLDICISTKL